MKNHNSLDWALDSLKPSAGPAASVPDSLRGMMLYCLYHDNFVELKRPWFFDGGDIYFYFSDGTGTYERGWVRYSFINAAPPAHYYPELWHMGNCIIKWKKTNDTTMDSLRAVRLFADARDKNILVSRLSKPTWSAVLSVKSDTFHLDYRFSSVDILVPVEYDCCQEYPEVFLKRGILVVKAFIAKGYEYLVAYPEEYLDDFPPLMIS
ncbi:hypothetical protein GF359_06655 [candidate division WOR-3 bacterium]|uniref:Uncharacterized protein n=1 Tax=candidate division WOR-3 bacterium TaxID=2052148 RepID=A0A9D5KB34_UNCW3|nr:hypothetical protein [candidate division WOR-3 bacterium]MBD3364879.1 hypothetical protein [candidate division WOR-3 bacterium]